MPRITDFCSCMYVLGCKFSLVRLCDSDFGITADDDITVGITCAAFCFHIANIAFASSRYLFCLSVIALARYYFYWLFTAIEFSLGTTVLTLVETKQIRINLHK